MKRYFLARCMRATGRLLLFIGAIISIGLIALHAYLFFYSLTHNGSTDFLIQSYTSTNTQPVINNSTPAGVFITILCILVALTLVAIIAKIYNHHMRSIIAAIAKFFHVRIFYIEIISTLIAWTITTLLLIITAPAASILAIFALIVNELLIVFAWGAYGQPNYKK